MQSFFSLLFLSLLSSSRFFLHLLFSSFFSSYFFIFFPNWLFFFSLASSFLLSSCFTEERRNSHLVVQTLSRWGRRDTAAVRVNEDEISFHSTWIQIKTSSVSTQTSWETTGSESSSTPVSVFFMSSVHTCSYFRSLTQTLLDVRKEAFQQIFTSGLVMFNQFLSVLE